MFIKIDNREKELISIISNQCIDKNIQIIVEMLPLGDVIISDDNGNDIIIIERKSICDLISSIKDGRYEEQSYRLSGYSHHNHNIIYLIEGNINVKKYDKNMIYSAIFSLNNYKGFSVIRTFSIQESADFIVNSVNKIIKNNCLKKTMYYSSPSNNSSSDSNNSPFCSNNSVSPSDSNNSSSPSNNSSSDSNNSSSPSNNSSYSSVVKKVKKENITADNIGEIMLCQIPGISSITAVAIMLYFNGSFQTFITQINENPECLKNITYINTKNQTKHLNKTIIENIVGFLANKK